MAYDLEEQEQLAELKGWWRDNGTLVLGAVAAAAIAFAGWEGWNAWHAKQAHQAAALYEAFGKALQKGEARDVREAGGALEAQYPGTLYASMAALAQAHFLFEQKDLKGAKAQLQWVIERSASEEMRDLARLRLAGVLLDEKAYGEALAALAAKHAQTLDAQFAARRGDVLLAKGQREEAKAAYREALAKAGGGDGEAFRDSVQLRLEGLGG
ncbi:MAG TPA: tetratricopeptide repeat protein [Burkholderiales bacterium]|nr:tetratricopeptide repeat protein [Burkholderiales bacterium]